MIDNYLSAKKYLDSLINYEKITRYPYKKSLKFKRVMLLFKYLKIPYERLRVIHIAGTKGKGSTAYYCSNFLAACGLKVGVYTSPHLFDFRERIVIKKSLFFPKEKKIEIKSRKILGAEVVKLTREIKEKLRKIDIPQKLGTVTFFEISTAIALKYFLDKKVDLVVLETGLGGRLDATNIVKPLVSLITHIGYDHMDKLGNRIKEIAYEKSGIIKRQVPVICSCQRRGVLEVIEAIAKTRKAPLFLSSRDFQIKDLKINKNLTTFNFQFQNFRLRKVKIKLKGKYQAENAALALATLFLLGKKEIIKRALTNDIISLNLEGRFELICKKPLIIADVAHNVSSFSVLADNLKLYYPKYKVILIFACSKDKDAKKMLKQIAYRNLILTRFDNPRTYEPLELKKVCRLKEVVLTDNIRQAFEEARKIYRKNDLILVSGSLFLVSEAKKFLVSSRMAKYH
ncbi:MAG: hypothetical protein KBB01_00645 [Candidatus Omnitrophica bacterium]|jgi:dihydrofolate synthase/folylpolyglutamate synthase|nr:hypothetical protein [Candidatus Omnitrophota bacterium]